MFTSVIQVNMGEITAMRNKFGAQPCMRNDLIPVNHGYPRISYYQKHIFSSIVEQLYIDRLYGNNISNILVEYLPVVF